MTPSIADALRPLLVSLLILSCAAISGLVMAPALDRKAAGADNRAPRARADAPAVKGAPV